MMGKYFAFFLIIIHKKEKCFYFFVEILEMKVTKGTILTSATAINEAIKIIGSERALAKAIGVYRQSIRYWRNNALLPCDKALKIFRATEGKVKLNELRPDLDLEFKEYEKLILEEYKQNKE